MKAMIFAAGIGSRLKPLTNTTPKALIKVNNTTLLEHNINYLIRHNVSKYIINVHHFSKQVIDFIKQKLNQVNITISDETDLLLDTGGGLKKASNFFCENEPFIVLNADILTNVNIDKMLSYHYNSRNDVTLAMRNRESTRKLLFSSEKTLIGWKNLKTNETLFVNKKNGNYTELAFSGLQILSPRIFKHFPADNKFSIIKFYLELAKYQKVGAFIDNDSYWFDVGTMEKLNQADSFFKTL